MIVVLVGVTALIGGAAAASVLYLQGRLDGGIERFGDPFAALEARPAAQPAASETPAVNFLVLGAESALSPGDPARWQEDSQRIETVMLAQLSGDRRSAHLLTLPHHALVDVPGQGRDTLAGAFADGGPSLTVATIEELTGVRLDHVAVVDFEAFAEVTDALGGVELPLPEPLVDEEGELVHEDVFDGDEANDHTREEPEDAGTEDAMRPQWIASTLSTALHPGAITDVATVGDVLESAGRAVSVDDGLTVSEIRNLAFSARHLTASQVVVLAAPTLPQRDEDTETVDLDDAELARLGEALATEQMPQYLAHAPQDVAVLRPAGS